MASQLCAKCGAHVAADEQFCPECGAFIDPLAPTPRPASGHVISVSSDGPGYEEFSLENGPPPEQVTEQQQAAPKEQQKTVSCPSCGAVNPGNNRHCQECGARLHQGPLPTAPRPAVQATAGVRAALAISGLLFVVIVVALLFNAFGGEEVATETTVSATTTTVPVVAEPAPIDVLQVECTPEGLGAFTCNNLISGAGSEYQVNWEELTLEEENVTIRLVFREPMIVTRIDWTNIEDSDRFRQNFRARGLLIDAQGALTEVPVELQDLPGTQTVTYAAVNANWIEVTVESAYQAEVVNGNVFREIAIDEITVIGRPANPTTNTTEADS